MADDPLDFTDQFNTSLGVADAPMWQSFSQKYGESTKYDYDMQGFHAANPDSNIASGNQNAGILEHFPDTYKKPNHPTFSTESIFHGKTYNDTHLDDKEGKDNELYEGGSWSLSDDGGFAFTPGATNLKNHSTQELLDYFKKYEPNNHLILPGQ